MAEILFGPEFALQTEIRIFQEDASLEDSRARDGQLVKRGPATGRSLRAREEIVDNGGYGLRTFRFTAYVPDQIREFRGDTGKASPVARIVLELEEYVENDVIGELREHAFTHIVIPFGETADDDVDCENPRRMVWQKN